MNAWRKHQKELILVCDQVRYTPSLRTCICLVTPGGGKSGNPVIVAANLISSIVDKICWICPRDNLRTQGEISFIDETFRALLGHKFEIRATLAEADPSRGAAGFVTTYQAVVADKYNLLTSDFKKWKYGLILDEPHHIALGSKTHASVQPLWDRAVVRILMSGCLERSDNEAIAFLSYLPPDSSGKSFVDLNDSADRRIIRYGLRDALEEHAIIPMWFELLDGSANWENKQGQEFKAEKISEVDNGEIGDAIFTTLRTDFALHLLQKTVEHWKAHRIHNPRALLLVVAPSIFLANKYFGWLRRMGLQACDIATSEENQLAKDNIELFKSGKLQALVTVAMAYEGMDVPAITHIACLTHIRARPWIEQMLARATRYDRKAGPWDHQRAWIFAPDDKLFQQVMEDMKAIQAPFVQETNGPGGGGGNGGGPRGTIPLGSKVDSARGSGLDADEKVEATEFADYQTAIKTSGLYGLATEYQAKLLMDELLRQKNNPTQQQQASRPTTKSEREKTRRDDIKQWIGSKFYDPSKPEIMEEINTAIIKRYGKSRTIMTEEELDRVFEERAIWSAQFTPRK